MRERRVMAEPKQAKGCKTPGLFYISFRQRNLVAERSEDGTWGKMQKPQQQGVAKKSKILKKVLKFWSLLQSRARKDPSTFATSLKAFPFNKTFHESSTTFLFECCQNLFCTYKPRQAFEGHNSLQYNPGSNPQRNQLLWLWFLGSFEKFNFR